MLVKLSPPPPPNLSEIEIPFFPVRSCASFQRPGGLGESSDDPDVGCLRLVVSARGQDGGEGKTLQRGWFMIPFSGGIFFFEAGCFR